MTTTPLLVDDYLVRWGAIEFEKDPGRPRVELRIVEMQEHTRKDRKMTYEEAMYFLQGHQVGGFSEFELSLDTISRHVRDLRQSRDDAHHVLMLHGVVPGADGTCRCDQCRNVAKAYDEAGYELSVTDRWWEE